jgi:hypothetical protein
MTNYRFDHSPHVLSERAQLAKRRRQEVLKRVRQRRAQLIAKLRKEATSL